MIDVDALRAELRDIDNEIAGLRQQIQENNSRTLLQFREAPGGVAGALLDNSGHFARYEELRDLRERLLLSLAAVDPQRRPDAT